MISKLPLKNICCDIYEVAIFFLSTKAVYEFQCWLLSMKCQWIFIFITQHSVLMQCICFYTFTHAACFLTIKVCNSKSILVNDYVFSCSFWDLNLLFFMVMTMYPIYYLHTWMASYLFKGIIYSKMKITQPKVVPNQYDFLSSTEHKRRYFEECG